MQFEWPETYLTEDEWGVYVRAKQPVLAQMWDSGEYDKYETFLTLYQLTYENFKDHMWSEGVIYAPYMPMMKKIMPKMLSDDIVSVQPMSEPAGEIFEFKSKKRA